MPHDEAKILSELEYEKYRAKNVTPCPLHLQHVLAI